MELIVHKIQDITDKELAYVIAESETQAMQVVKQTTVLELKWLESRELKSIPKWYEKYKDCPIPKIVINHIMPF